MVRRALLVLMMALATVVSTTDLGRAQAQGGITISLVPARVELEVSPGARAEQTVVISLKAGEALHMRAYADDLSPPDFGNYVVAAERLAPPATEWVQISPQEFTVSAGERQEVEVVVAPPPDVLVGNYQAAVFMEASSGRESEGSGNVIVRPRLGAMVLVDVVPEGEELSRKGKSERGHLEVETPHLFKGWLPRPQALWERPQARIREEFVNVGDTYLRVLGTFTFQGAMGASFEEQVGPVTVLRGAGRTFESEWSKAPLAGSLNGKSELVYLKSRGEAVTISNEYSSFIMPWAQIEFGLLALSVVAVAWGVWQYRRRRAEAGPASHGQDEDTSGI